MIVSETRFINDKDNGEKSCLNMSDFRRWDYEIIITSSKQKEIWTLLKINSQSNIMSDNEEKTSVDNSSKIVEEIEDTSRRRSTRAKAPSSAATSNSSAKKDPKAAKAPSGKRGAPKRESNSKAPKGGKKKDLNSDEELSEVESHLSQIFIFALLVHSNKGIYTIYSGYRWYQRGRRRNWRRSQGVKRR